MRRRPLRSADAAGPSKKQKVEEAWTELQAVLDTLQSSQAVGSYLATKDALAVRAAASLPSSCGRARSASWTDLVRALSALSALPSLVHAFLRCTSAFPGPRAEWRTVRSAAFRVGSRVAAHVAATNVREYGSACPRARAVELAARRHRQVAGRRARPPCRRGCAQGPPHRRGAKRRASTPTDLGQDGFETSKVRPRPLSGVAE